ncbi:MAG: replication-associated recombination protein A [Pseudomonadota bacterium]
MDLFSYRASKSRLGQPLAERMRPRTLDEFMGQSHILGEGRLLRRVMQSGELPSLLLWGPPGSGKTTLARIVAERSGHQLVALSAVVIGVPQLREIIAEAAERLNTYGKRTVLFLDEIHRFHKGQQDVLLPHVEMGTVILIGATTENPSFEVNAALLSRCKVVRLEPLGEQELRSIIDRAIADPEKGLGKNPPDAPPEVRDRIAREAQGDARRALSALEIAASIAKRIDDNVLAEAFQRKTLLYDKAGDEHYDVVSAFIKSMRGSDPDAAVYWLARMLEAGEDPLFVLRRMVIFAAEDIGVADPRALSVAVSALDAFRFVGMPEGVLPITQAVLFLATAPKTSSALKTYAAAREAVTTHGSLPVPLRIRNAPTRLMKDMGYGAGYQNPHDFDGHYVNEVYLPDKLRDAKFFEPSDSGYERQIAERLARWRAQRPLIRR